MSALLIVGCLVGAGLLYAQSSPPAPEHRVWKGIRTQELWHEHGRALPPTFRVGLSRSGRAQVRFTISPRKQIIAEGNRFTVFTVASGLRIAAMGSASRIGGRAADFAGIWLRPTGEIGYEASWQTDEVTWKETEHPPDLAVSKPPTSVRIRSMGRASDDTLRLELSPSGQARLSFTILPDGQTSVSTGALAIASGRDGLYLVSGGRAVLATPASPTGVTVDRIELWMTSSGGIAYRSSASADR